MVVERRGLVPGRKKKKISRSDEESFSLSFSPSWILEPKIQVDGLSLLVVSRVFAKINDGDADADADVAS